MFRGQESTKKKNDSERKLRMNENGKIEYYDSEDEIAV
jgi:hypothetical protein